MRLCVGSPRESVCPQGRLEAVRSAWTQLEAVSEGRQTEVTPLPVTPAPVPSPAGTAPAPAAAARKDDKPFIKKGRRA